MCLSRQNKERRLGHVVCEVLILHGPARNGQNHSAVPPGEFGERVAVPGEGEPLDEISVRNFGRKA